MCAVSVTNTNPTYTDISICSSSRSYNQPCNTEARILRSHSHLPDTTSMSGPCAKVRELIARGPHIKSAYLLGAMK